MGRTMTKLQLKYVNEYLDRFGKVRRYFRRGRKNLGALPGEVGSEEFMAAYAAYLGNRTVKPSAPAPASHADSLSHLVTEYYQHPMFTQRKEKTRKLYRLALDAVLAEHGHRSISLMTAENAEKIIYKIGADRPAMANLTRAVLRRVMSLAVKRKLRTDNPFADVEAYEIGTHHTWTDAELQKYERRWPLGTRQRLAYALLLYTDQRGWATWRSCADRTYLPA
jgi:enterobacteria phage integrase